MKKFFGMSDLVGVKEVFDNLRNYFICGGLFSLRLWIEKNPVDGFHESFIEWFVYVPLVLSIVCVIQTFVIVSCIWNQAVKPHWESKDDNLPSHLTLFCLGLGFILVLIAAILFAGSMVHAAYSGAFS